MLQVMNTTINKKELRRIVYEQIIGKLVWQKPMTNNQKRLLERWINEYKVDREVLKFYTDKRVLYEIVKYLGNKELCFDSKIRWLLAIKIDQLIYYFYFYKMFENLKTCYCGLSYFMRREPPPMNPREKTEWQQNYWASKDNPKYLELINGYDLGIDLDADTFKNAYSDAKKLFKFFERFNIRFSIWCSGKKGWHFKIPYEEFADLIKPFNIDKTVEFCRFVALDLKDKLKLRKIDLIIYSATRFLKLPYSLDKRNKKCILPLEKEEFLNFKELYMDMNYCLSKDNLGYRGTYFMDSNPKGFKEMINAI